MSDGNVSNVVQFKTRNKAEPKEETIYRLGVFEILDNGQITVVIDAEATAEDYAFIQECLEQFKIIVLEIQEECQNGSTKSVSETEAGIQPTETID